MLSKKSADPTTFLKIRRPKPSGTPVLSAVLEENFHFRRLFVVLLFTSGSMNLFFHPYGGLSSFRWRRSTFSMTRQPSASLRPAKVHHFLQGKALCAFVLVMAPHAGRRKLSRAAFAVRQPAACPALDSFRRTAYPRRRRKTHTTSKSLQQIPVCLRYKNSAAFSGSTVFFC